jgi:hypothetical protein
MILIVYNEAGINGAKALANAALEQFNAKQYDGPFKTAKKVGIAIDDGARQITEWVEM